MIAGVPDRIAREWVRYLEDKEARRSGTTLKVARTRVASRLGIPPGTLENLSRDRVKGVRHWVISVLHEAMKAEVKREMAAHKHELEKLEAMGGHPDEVEVRAAVAMLQESLGEEG